MTAYMIPAGILGFLGVALGAFGAHALHSFLETQQRLPVWNTAVLYLLLHACALLALSMSPTTNPQTPLLRWAARCWIAGILLFSGSLFALALSGIRGLGAITPVGGLSLLLGWCLVCIAGLRLRKSEHP